MHDSQRIIFMSIQMHILKVFCHFHYDHFVCVRVTCILYAVLHIGTVSQLTGVWLSVPALESLVSKTNCLLHVERDVRLPVCSFTPENHQWLDVVYWSGTDTRHITEYVLIVTCLPSMFLLPETSACYIKIRDMQC